MVQLQNSDRLKIVIDFGTMVLGDEDENGNASEEFKSSFKMLAGVFSLTMNQAISLAGLSQNKSHVYLVRHRLNQADWEGITTAMVGSKQYEVTNIEPDSYDNFTAYDRVTLQEVTKHG